MSSPHSSAPNTTVAVTCILHVALVCWEVVFSCCTWDTHMEQPVSIIGAGNLGGAMAAHLRSKHHPVLLAGTCAHPGIIPQVNARGGLLTMVDGSGGPANELEGATYYVSTGDIPKALENNIIIVAVPISAQPDVIHQLAQFTLTGKILIFMPIGFSTGLLRAALTDAEMPQLIVGTVSSPFASRVRNNARIAITRTKLQLEIAASIRRPSTKIKKLLQGLVPQPLVWYPNLASVFISNGNPVIHPPTMLESAAEIAGPGLNPLFYEQCMNRAADRIDLVDTERVSLAMRLGLSTNILHGYFKAWYTPTATSYINSVNDTPSYRGRRAPPLSHRYITEDVKFLIVFMHATATKLGVKLPGFNALINDASRWLGENLWETGMTLEKLSLEDASASDIVTWLNGELDMMSRS